MAQGFVVLYASEASDVTVRNIKQNYYKVGLYS